MVGNRWFYLFLLLACCMAEKCPPDFLGRCTCGKTTYIGQERYVVNCTNSNFKSAAVLEVLPNITEAVIFTGNDIKSMPWNVFGKLNDYPKLQIIDMSNNNIEEIKGKTYHHVKNVQVLILNHNNLNITGDKTHPRIFSNFVNLEALHLTNAFTESVDSKDYLMNLEQIFVRSNLTGLKKIHLEQNEIWTFKNPKIFCNLPHLMDLHLGDNKLSDINFNFECLKELRYIDLRDNKIHFLPEKTIAKLQHRAKASKDGSLAIPALQINMNANPFICNCKIADTLTWMRTTTIDVVDKESYKCYDGLPESNENKFLIDVKELECPVALPTVHQGTTVVLGVLVVLLISLLLIIGYMNYSNLRKTTVTVWDKVCRRGQYTSILSKPEDQEVHV